MVNMNQQKTSVDFKEMDIFTLLRLDHLSAEEKAKRIVEIQQAVLANFLDEDLPKILSDDKWKQFESLVKDKSRTGEIENWLRENVSDFDKIILDKMLTAKKEIVKHNMLTRLDVNQKEAEDTEVQKDQKRMEELAKEKETLDKIILAVDSNDWETASSLISTL